MMNEIVLKATKAEWLHLIQWHHDQELEHANKREYADAEDHKKREKQILEALKNI